MCILIVTPYYLPDGGPSAPLYTMLSEGLAGKRHDVTVISAVPHYPSGGVHPDYQNRWVKKKLENGVNILRVPVPSMKRSNLFLRLLQLLIYQLWATVVGLPRDYEVVVFSNPFFMVGLPFFFLAVMRHKPVIYSVHDIYPDVGIRLRIFRHRLVISAVTKMEKFCLDRATYVRILSESFVPAMRRLGVPESKMVLIYDWVDTDLIKPLTRSNAFASEHDLLDKFVVLYAGNLGLSQSLEHVLTAAKLLANHQDIIFLFVGDGVGRASLLSDAEQCNLTNVKFLPFQPRSRLPEVLATADVSLVSLQKGVGMQSLPSKSFSILASGRPLVASLDEGSDSWNLIMRSQAGLCVPPEDPDRLADAILKLKQDPALRRQLGQNGRAYALQNHSPEAAVQQFERLLEAVQAAK